jgi:hypothetical protein
VAGTTPKRLLPYPTNGDTPNVAGDIANLATAVDTKLGSAGKSIIATEETRTNVAYGTLTTPDVVTGIVLPTDGDRVHHRSRIRRVLHPGEVPVFV